MILEESPIVTDSCWKDWFLILCNRTTAERNSKAVSSCLKLTSAKPKTRDREMILLFSIKTSGINTVEVEEVFKTMNDDGITKNEYTVPLNEFMVEIKKNYEWNKVLEQPSTGTKGTWAHLVLGWILLCSELSDVVVCNNWLDDCYVWCVLLHPFRVSFYPKKAAALGGISQETVAIF